MKVTKQDILKIKSGTSMTFHFDSYESLKSIKTYCYQLRFDSEKPKNVRRYTCSANNEKLILTITAIPNEQEN